MTKYNNQVTASEVKKKYRYDPQTGVMSRVNYRGKVTILPCRPIRINGIFYNQHRLAWLMMTGCWPKDQIDHIDLNKNNNAFNNLREATSSDNCCNKKVMSNSGTQVKGVHLTMSGTYFVQIQRHGKRYQLGTYPTVEAAADAYAKKAAELHGEFARTK